MTGAELAIAEYWTSPTGVEDRRITALEKAAR